MKDTTRKNLLGPRIFTRLTRVLHALLSPLYRTDKATIGNQDGRFHSYLCKVSLVDSEGGGTGEESGDNSELHGDSDGGYAYKDS